jgi:hypothetical protein
MGFQNGCHFCSVMRGSRTWRTLRPLRLVHIQFSVVCLARSTICLPIFRWLTWGLDDVLPADLSVTPSSSFIIGILGFLRGVLHTVTTVRAHIANLKLLLVLPSLISLLVPSRVIRGRVTSGLWWGGEASLYAILNVLMTVRVVVLFSGLPILLPRPWVSTALNSWTVLAPLLIVC